MLQNGLYAWPGLPINIAGGRIVAEVFDNQTLT